MIISFHLSSVARRMPINYGWRRDGLPFPTSAVILENNRVVEIFDAQIEDSGVYHCRASRGTTRFAEKSVTLTIQGRFQITSSKFPLSNVNKKSFCIDLIIVFLYIQFTVFTVYRFQIALFSI
jgi:alpha-D-ribose 1-methylphosphonate 5-phosphate C-P lyase